MARKKYPPMVCKSCITIVNSKTGEKKKYEMDALTPAQKAVVSNELNRNLYNAIYASKGAKAEFKGGARRVTDEFAELFWPGGQR